MEKFIVFIVLCFASFNLVFGAKDIACDHTFGDPTWDYSKVFFDEDITFPAGAKTHSVILPAQKGLMISYVCITLPEGIDKNTVTTSFHPLSREVFVALATKALQPFTYHVTANRHGY